MAKFVNVEKFKEEATSYMQKYAITTLWAYGRKVGVSVATKLKKQEVILEALAVLCGEKAPEFTSRGAPRRNDFVPPELIAGIDELAKIYLPDETPTLTPTPTPTPTPIVQVEKRNTDKPYYKITVQKGNGEEVMSLGTSLHFQILLSNEKLFASADMAQEANENNP